jgi:hypothetical protein
MADFGISEALLVASAASSAIGSIAGATGNVQQGKAEAQADLTNAAIQRQNAEIVKQQADAQAAIDTEQTERTLGQARAAYGASGVDVTRGSPLEVMADQAASGELTRQLDLYKGAVQATGNLAQAGLLQQEAGAAQRAGQIRGASTLLTGLAGAARSAVPLFSTSRPATAPQGSPGLGSGGYY